MGSVGVACCSEQHPSDWLAIRAICACAPLPPPAPAPLSLFTPTITHHGAPQGLTTILRNRYGSTEAGDVTLLNLYMYTRTNE